MVLRMKNFNILGAHWKVRLLGGFTKNKYIGEIGQFANLRGAWKKEGVVFLMGGGLIPQWTLCEVYLLWIFCGKRIIKLLVINTEEKL